MNVKMSVNGRIGYMEHVVEDCQENVESAMKNIREFTREGKSIDRFTGKWIRSLANDLDKAYTDLLIAEGKLEALRYAEKEVEE